MATGLFTIQKYHAVRSLACIIYRYLQLPLLWRCSSLVVSALDFRSGGRWFEPGLCRRVVSIDKKLYSKLSLAGVQIDTGDYDAGASHPGGE